MFIKLPPREEGQGLVEYALILVLVAVVVIAILLVLGPAIGSVFSQIVLKLQLGGGGGGQSLSITQFNVQGTVGAGCVVKINTLQADVTVGGLPASGVSVGGTVTLANGTTTSLGSKTTDSSGRVVWTNTSV